MIASPLRERSRQNFRGSSAPPGNRQDSPMIATGSAFLITISSLPTTRGYALFFPNPHLTYSRRSPATSFAWFPAVSHFSAPAQYRSTLVRATGQLLASGLDFFADRRAADAHGCLMHSSADASRQRGRNTTPQTSIVDCPRETRRTSRTRRPQRRRFLRESASGAVQFSCTENAPWDGSSSAIRERGTRRKRGLKTMIIGGNTRTVARDATVMIKALSAPR